MAEELWEPFTPELGQREAFILIDHTVLMKKLCPWDFTGFELN